MTMALEKYEARDDKQPKCGSLSFDLRKVLIKGLEPSVPAERVKIYMQSLTEATVQDVVICGSTGNALVTFTDQQDFENLASAITKAKNEIEGCKITLERVPHCHCITVTGLCKNTTEDAVKFYFENPRTGCGEEPSKIELQEYLGIRRARLHFKNHSALEKLLHKHHTLDGAEIKVTPFYPFLEEEIYKTKIDVHPHVMDYIKKNYEKEFERVLDENALELQWIPKETFALVTERASTVRGDMGDTRGDKVESLLEFLKEFEDKVFTVGCDLFNDVVEGLRNQFGDKDPMHIELSFDEQSFSVYIVGKKQDIGDEEKRIGMIIEEVTKEKRLQDSVITHTEDDITSEQLAVLKKSNLIDHLQESYKYTSIEIDEEKGQVIIHGPKNKLLETTAEVLRFLHKVDKGIVRLPERVLNVFQSPKGVDYITNALKEQNVIAVLAIDTERKSTHEAFVYAMNSDHCNKAVKIIESFAIDKALRLQDESMPVVKTRKWKELIAQQKDELVVHTILDDRAQTLWISGVKQDVIQCYSIVEEHIDKYTIFKDSIDAIPGNLRYLFKVWNHKVKEIQNDLKESFLKVEPDYKDMKIKMSGNKYGLKMGQERLNSLIEKIRHEKIKVDKPGMAKFFRSSDGARQIKVVESENSCTVEVIEGKDELESERKSFASQINYPCDYEIICSYKTPEGKTLSVCKGDLTKHHADVIVNAANNQLKHSGGLAGAIVRAGGFQIQEECDKYIKEREILPTGKVMDTGPGKLPCKRIIHAVGPRWSRDADKRRGKGQVTKEEKLLNTAIKNCLLHAKDYHSIAIPAVSSGIFGFPGDLCASTLIQSTMDFFRRDPSCKLSEVRFLNIDDKTLDAFKIEMKKAFEDDGLNGASSAEISARKVSPEPSRNEVLVTPAIFDDSKFSTPEGISISVKVGDIAQENSDVLVNTAGKELNLQNNACAKSLSKAAGPELQKSCNAIAPVEVGKIGVTPPGNLKCKHVFHAVCGEWKNGSGQNILSAVVAKCLKKAEKRGATSISFPAIGTGVLGFPRDVVAKTSIDEVIKFSCKTPTSHLKEVTFVVYSLDQPSIKSFKDEVAQRSRSTVRHSPVNNSAARRDTTETEFQEREPVPQAPIPTIMINRKPKLFEIKLGKLTVQVLKGDITHEKTDAIGMFSNTMLDFEGAAWAAIKSAAGRRGITLNENVYLPITHGQAVMHSSGDLNVGNLIISSAFQHKKPLKLSRCLLSCLEKAEGMEFKSISFPALGTGNAGLSSKDCANFMLSAAKEFSKKQPKSMQLIRIVVFKEVMIGDFIAVMRKHSVSRKKAIVQSLWRGVKKGAVRLRSKLSNKEEQDGFEGSEMSLEVYSGTSRNLKAGVKSLNDIMKEKSTMKKINKETIADIEEAQMDEIHLLELQLHCKITVDKFNFCIIVEGLSEDVLQATSVIHEMLHKIVEAKYERTKAESIAKDVQWQYEKDNEFIPYAIEANAKIETAFDNKEESVTFEENGQHFTIKFSDMIEISSEEGVDGHTNVKRKDLRLGDVSVPDHWDAQPKTTSGVENAVHLVDLDPKSQEFLEVKTRFNHSCRCNIKRIRRVQNPEQYKIYSIRKQKMDEKFGSNEKKLFHGTAAESCESINQNGFNRSYCGKNATMYGQGVYFAENAEYSARQTYSPPDSKGIRYMYSALVLAGEYTKGNATMIVPPPKNANQPNETYDTVVNNESNPSIFVVFKDGQAYPEYLIEFND